MKNLMHTFQMILMRKNNPKKNIWTDIFVDYFFCILLESSEINFDIVASKIGAKPIIW